MLAFVGHEQRIYRVEVKDKIEGQLMHVRLQTSKDLYPVLPWVCSRNKFKELSSFGST
jgi:hypothetical protein